MKSLKQVWFYPRRVELREAIATSPTFSKGFLLFLFVNFFNIPLISFDQTFLKIPVLPTWVWKVIQESGCMSLRGA